MPKITSVELQKKNPRRYNIFLDGQFAFGADEDLVVSRRLLVGKIISSEELEQILFEAEVGKLMERMYRLFSIRQRSEKEVKDYFRIKNYQSKVKGEEEKSQLVIEVLIKNLKQKGLINDWEFAKAWVESRRRSKQKGVKAIRMELLQKGINKEIIEQVVGHQLSAVSEEQIAEKALEKKAKVWKNLETMDFRKKAIDFLFRKGFEYEVIKQVLDKFPRT